MHEVKADLDKNRIYITVGRVENEEEMGTIVEKVKSECLKLKKDFTCLTDLRNYEYQDEIFEKYIKEAQESLLEAGMSQVVRVHRQVGMLGHLQFETVSLDLGYRGQNVTSIEEAEDILDGKTK